MNDYASLNTWLSLVRDEFHSTEEYNILDVESTCQDLDTKALQNRAFHSLKSGYVGIAGLDPNRIWWLGNCIRKFEYGCTATKHETVEAFIGRDNSLRASNPTIPWWAENRMKTLLARALSEFDFGLQLADGRFGPGATAERLDAISRWTVASDFSFDIRTMSLLRGGAWSETGPARLCCVPKSRDSHRLITIEPAENTFGQQYVRMALLYAIHAGPLSGSVMDLLLTEWGPDGKPSGGLNVRKQQRRCLLASGNARLATVDLKDASDGISWANVVRVFPPAVVSYLERFRTPTVADGRRKHQLFMFAGMGNATTFVVETLYFWALVTAISEKLSVRKNIPPVTVFGDDIICDNGVASSAMFNHYMLQAGHVVNELKTCTSLFPSLRESCGLTAFEGKPLATLYRISGYDTGSDADIQRLCSVANRAERDSLDRKLPANQRGLATKVSLMLDPVRGDLSENLGVPLCGRLPMSECHCFYVADPCRYCCPNGYVWPEWEGRRLAAMRMGAGSQPPNRCVQCRVRLEQGSFEYLPHIAEIQIDEKLHAHFIKVRVTEPKVHIVSRSSLTPSEGLGIISRQLATTPTKKRTSRTLISIASKTMETKSRWVKVT